MGLKLNMYIRTPLGIDKIIELIDENNLFNQYECEQDNLIIYKKCNDFGYGALCFDKSELKTSYNIIDLIEVGDYVNDSRVYYCYCADEDSTGLFIDTEKGRQWLDKPSQIKSIVTKEQFESMEYRIGE